MNEAQMQRRVDQLPSVEQKVLGAVPYGEPWGHAAIMGELSRKGLGLDLSNVLRCLERLKEAGLVKEPKAREFIRVKSKPAATERPAPAESVPPSQSAPGEGESVNGPVDPLEALAGLACRVRGMRQALDALADDIEVTALAVAEQVAAASRGGEKLRQLQALLRELGQ